MSCQEEKKISHQSRIGNHEGDTNQKSAIITAFSIYSSELDAHHDKYERLVKKSRDLTIESKRIIFLLHRISSNTKNNEDILKEAENRLITLSTGVLDSISAELTKKEVYLFLKAFTSGLQEYVEALSFYYYLKHGKLIDIEETYKPDFIQDLKIINSEQSASEDRLPFSDILNPMVFILGIADLTGELMRKCINSVANGNMDEPFVLCSVLQAIYKAFLVTQTNSKELRQKLFTLKHSLLKVENACYAINIRGTEVPKHMLADLFCSEQDLQDVKADCDI